MYISTHTYTYIIWVFPFFVVHAGTSAKWYDPWYGPGVWSGVWSEPLLWLSRSDLGKSLRYRELRWWKQSLEFQEINMCTASYDDSDAFMHLSNGFPALPPLKRCNNSLHIYNF